MSLQGNEPLPRIANRSERDTGFTSGTVARPGFVHRVMSDVSMGLVWYGITHTQQIDLVSYHEFMQLWVVYSFWHLIEMCVHYLSQFQPYSCSLIY